MPNPPIPTDALAAHLAQFMREHGIETLTLKLAPNDSLSGDVRFFPSSPHAETLIDQGEEHLEHVRGGSRQVREVAFRREGFGPSLRVDLVIPMGPDSVPAPLKAVT